MTGDPYGRLARWQDALLEPLNAPLREIGLKLVPPRAGMRVLDVGCGTGVQLERYQRAGCVISGVDTSPAMLERARQRLGASADLRLQSAEALPYPDHHFDLVVSSLMLHELSPSARTRVVSEMTRTLATDGRILVTDFHPGPWTMPKGWIYRGVSLIAEIVARHHDRSAVFLAEGGVPTLADQAGLTVERTKVVSGGNIALYVLRQPAGEPEHAGGA